MRMRLLNASISGSASWPFEAARTALRTRFWVRCGEVDRDEGAARYRDEMECVEPQVIGKVR